MEAYKGTNMIWGKTHKELEEQLLLKDMRWFAWHPVRLRDGRWVWLERLNRYYNTRGNPRRRVYKQRGVKI